MRQRPHPIPVEHRTFGPREISAEWLEGMPLVVTVKTLWVDARNPTRKESMESSSYLWITEAEFETLAKSLGYVKAP